MRSGHGGRCADRQLRVTRTNALRHSDCACEVRSRGRVCVEGNCVRRCCEPLVGKASADIAAHLAGAHRHLEHTPLHRLSGRDCVVSRRDALAAAGRRHAADVGPEAGSTVRAVHETTEEHRFLGGRDTRIDRAAELSHEADVDTPARKLGVEPADDEPLRARELELHLSRRGEHPRTCHRDADLQPPALVRRARGRRCDRACADDGGKGCDALHGTALRNQNAERPPPASRSTIAPPAKRSLICRLWVLCPVRVASDL